jgi:hypothetical protein
MRAVQKHLEPEKVLESLKPEVLSLSHDGVEDAEFSPIPF